MSQFDHFTSTVDDEEYKGHTIRALAHQPAHGSRWTVLVHVQRHEDAEWLPPIVDHDHSYDTAAQALQAGRARARDVIDRAE